MTVYFISEKDRADAPVKIGTSSDLGKRLSGLQSSNHVELEILASLDGGRETEAYLHESLSSSRIRGEWFERSPEVDAAIRRAIESGSASLPFADPGNGSKKYSSNQDVADAMSCLRKIATYAPAELSSDGRNSWLCRRLGRFDASFTPGRVKTLFYGEAKRINHHEMMAINALQVELDRNSDYRLNVIYAPIVAEILDQVGEPLTDEQAAVVDRLLAEGRVRLAADKVEWGYDAHARAA